MIFYDYMKDKSVFSREELEEIQQIENRKTTPERKVALISRVIANQREGSEIDRIVISNVKTMFNPILGNIEYNKRGLHVLRVLYSMQAHLERNELTGQKDEEFNTLGFSYKKLDFDDAQIISKFKDIPYSSNKQKENIIEILDKEEYEIMHEVRDALFEFIINAIPSSNKFQLSDIGNKYRTNTFCQKILNDPKDNDIQKVLHSDIFFPALKFWYYPEKVKSGCLVYVPESHYPHGKLLDYYYEESIRDSYDPWPKDHKEGSFRISDEKLDEMEIYTPINVEVSAGSLVIANMHGLHARAEVISPVERIAIHGSIRIERPFDV